MASAARSTACRYRFAAAAGFEVFERTTRRYGKPEFELPVTTVDKAESPVITERRCGASPFCELLHFERALPEGARLTPGVDRRAESLPCDASRGTVEAMPAHEVYINDWIDARAACRR